MKRYRIIGKSNQMRSVFLFDPVLGRDVQHKIRRGVTIDINEDQMTFHVERQKGYKILDVIELPEELPEEPPKVEVSAEPEVAKETVPWPEPEPEVEDSTPTYKRGKSRTRKSQIDLDESDDSGDS